MKAYPKTLFLSGLLVLLAVILSACGGDISNTEAEEAIQDALNGNLEEANEFICEAQQLTDADMQGIEGMEVEDVSCEKDGDNMECTYSILVNGSPAEFQSTITIEDGKLCSGLDFTALPAAGDPGTVGTPGPTDGGAGADTGAADSGAATTPSPGAAAGDTAGGDATEEATEDAAADGGAGATATP